MNGLGPREAIYREDNEFGTIRGRETNAFRHVVPND